jgi:hypothetical protein
MKQKIVDKAEKKMVAIIDKEMNLPRLTESVREGKPLAKKSDAGHRHQCYAGTDWN